MCEGRHISWANNRVRVSPYPLRSSRNNIHYAPELAIQPEWEDASKRLNPIETLNCPLCRGEVIEMTTVTSTGRRFMNAKPRSFPVNDCEFSGTYSKLDKHLKTEHPDLFESVMF
ncbi:hypothetical protein V5N11_004511 [Cardamine amara subsp. amara]|uniref:Uncharacterized protein n=1 Tax=Cardamine amara subsp. amara TaxID=228776 RepID=A0ABD1C3V0_CARAN